MEWLEILDRIRAHEGDQTEFKRWDAFPKKIGEAICAFGNTEGGLIIIGISDDGQILGVAADPDEVQEKLTSLLQSGLSAPVRARLGYHRDPAGWVHWIEVRRYRGPEPLRHHGRVLVRRGRSNVEPSPSELQDLYNAFGFILTEEQMVPGTAPGDIDLEVFRDFLRRQKLDLSSGPQPDAESDLLNRGVITDEEGTLRVTLYGLMCFGRQPQAFGPTRSAWLEMVAYAGTDRASEVILQGEGKGRLDEQVERALGWMKALGTREEYREHLRIDHPVVPARALREALVNAVAHRDYAVLGSKVLLEVFSDRVVVTSPGELPNHLRPEFVLAGAHPRSRNELMAHYLLVKGFMEMRGRGFPVMWQEMQAFNGTEPQLISSREGRFVRVTLLRDRPTASRAVGGGTSIG